MASWLYEMIWPSVSPEEMLKRNLEENKKCIRDSIRKLKREAKRMDVEMVRKENEMRAAANTRNKGRRERLLPMAKEIARIRKRRERTLASAVKLEAVCGHLGQMKTHVEITNAIVNAVDVMQKMHARLGPQGVQTLMAEFDKQSELGKMMEECINDIIDEDDEDELLEDDEETNELVERILDELDVGLASRLADAPSTKGATPASAKKVPTGGNRKEKEKDSSLGGEDAAAAAGDADLHDRLNKLNKGDDGDGGKS